MSAYEPFDYALEIEELLIETVAVPGGNFEETLAEYFEDFPPVEDNLQEITFLSGQFLSGMMNRKDFRLALHKILARDPEVVVKQASEKLQTALRQKVNFDLVKAKLDGTMPWPRLAQALNKIGEVLYNNGISHDIMSADRFRGSEGRAVLDIDFINAEDPFSPVQISNSSLVITYHKFEETGRWEVIAYLS